MIQVSVDAEREIAGSPAAAGHSFHDFPRNQPVRGPQREYRFPREVLQLMATKNKTRDGLRCIPLDIVLAMSGAGAAKRLFSVLPVEQIRSRAIGPGSNHPPYSSAYLPHPK